MLFKTAPCIHTQIPSTLSVTRKMVANFRKEDTKTWHYNAKHPTSRSPETTKRPRQNPIRKRRHTALNNMYQGLMTATAQSIVQHQRPRLLLLTQVMKMMYRHMLFQPAPSPPSPPPPPPPLRVKTTFLHTEFWNLHNWNILQNDSHERAFSPTNQLGRLKKKKNHHPRKQKQKLSQFTTQCIHIQNIVQKNRWTKSSETKKKKA